MLQAAFKAGHAESLLVLVHYSQPRTLAWFSEMIFEMAVNLYLIFNFITINVKIPKNHAIFSVTDKNTFQKTKPPTSVQLASKRYLS